MVIVVAFEELLGRQVHGSRVALCLGQERRWIVEVERHMVRLVEDPVEDIRLGKDRVVMEVLGYLVVVEASREGEVDLELLVAVGAEQDLDLLVMLDQPLYHRKGCLDHVQSREVLEKARRVVEDRP